VLKGKIIKSIDAGVQFSLALGEENEIFSWGDNSGFF
jgi:alpha-tubulin suppressor-like RCC1 family protein